MCFKNKRDRHERINLINGIEGKFCSNSGLSVRVKLGSLLIHPYAVIIIIAIRYLVLNIESLILKLT